MLIRFSIIIAILSVVSLGGSKKNKDVDGIFDQKELKVELIEFTDPIIITPSH